MEAVTLLVLGSLTGGYNALLDVRESLVGVKGSFADHADVAVYTGTLEPTPDYLPRSATDECTRLERRFGGITSDIPVVAVPGHHNHEVSRRPVLERDGYAPADGVDDRYVDEFDELTYAPLDDTVTAGGVQFTQNPTLADEGVLLTHEFYPELFEACNAHGEHVYLSGAGLYGRYRGNALNTLFTGHDLGPGADVYNGGYYLVDVGSTGIESVEFGPLGNVSVGTCRRHADRGEQYTVGELRCPFCRDESLYFEELLREATLKSRQEGGQTRLSDLLGHVVETYELTEDQRDDLRTFAHQQSDAANLFDVPVPSLGHQKTNSRDPTAVASEQYLYASEELDLDQSSQVSYFDEHRVQRKRDVAPTDLPPAETDGQRTLDESAYHELPQGEWLCFPRPDDVVDVWHRITALVADRTFYDARVGTEWTRIARQNESHAIIVAVPNYFDRNDVGRVYRRLKAIDGAPTETLLFKPLLYTMYGIDGSTAREFDLPHSVRYDRSEFEE